MALQDGCSTSFLSKPLLDVKSVPISPKIDCNAGDRASMSHPHLRRLRRMPLSSADRLRAGHGPWPLCAAALLAGRHGARRGFASGEAVESIEIPGNIHGFWMILDRSIHEKWLEMIPRNPSLRADELLGRSWPKRHFTKCIFPTRTRRHSTLRDGQGDGHGQLWSPRGRRGVGL